MKVPLFKMRLLETIISVVKETGWLQGIWQTRIFLSPSISLPGVQWIGFTISFFVCHLDFAPTPEPSPRCFVIIATLRLKGLPIFCYLDDMLALLEAHVGSCGYNIQNAQMFWKVSLLSEELNVSGTSPRVPGGLL